MLIGLHICRAYIQEGLYAGGILTGFYSTSKCEKQTKVKLPVNVYLLW